MAQYPCFDDNVAMSAAITDFGDGDDVIVNGTGHYYSQVTKKPVGRYIVGLNQNGSNRSGYPAATNDVLLASPAVGDLLGNGGREVVDVTEGGTLYAVDGNGHSLPGFPLSLPGNTFAAGPAIAPVDGSGREGIYVASYSGLEVFSMADLGSPTIEPLASGSRSFSTPTIASLGNGSLSVLLTSASGTYGCGATDTYHLRIWTVNGTSPAQLTPAAWPTFHGNMHRSGSNLAVTAPPPTAIHAVLSGSNQAQVTWTPPKEAAAYGVSGYTVTTFDAKGQPVGTPVAMPSHSGGRPTSQPPEPPSSPPPAPTPPAAPPTRRPASPPTCCPATPRPISGPPW